MPAITASANISLTSDPQARTMASPSTWHDDIMEADDLAPVKGIIFGFLLGLAIWAPVIGYFLI